MTKQKSCKERINKKLDNRITNFKQALESAEKNAEGKLF